MKKIDVVQPYAMGSPFAQGVYSASSTSDFEIPAETSTAEDDTCVIDDGFLPITSTDLDDGGIAPERKNFNGLFYLSTDQRFYLQNGGIITYNANVASEIGGYPQDAILDYITTDNQYIKVRSLIDDNTYNFTLDETLIDGEHWEKIDMGGSGTGYQMFDICMKDHVLTFDETKGFAQLGTYVYKDAIAGSRYGYSDFYAKCIEEYTAGTTVNQYMSSNINVVGSITNNNGVISGFSTSNYALIDEVFAPSTNAWEACFKFTTGADVSTTQSIIENSITTTFGAFDIHVKSTKFYVSLSSNGTSGDIADDIAGSYTVLANTTYYIKLQFTETQYILSYSTDGETYTADITVTSSTAVYQQGKFIMGIGYGGSSYSDPFLGSIDLNGCYTNIDGSHWWTGTNVLTYKEADNKHRFYDIGNKAYFDNFYGITGEAWYYGVDTTNERIFLPRSTRFKNGTSVDVGQYQEAGLPNITGTLVASDDNNNYATGAFQVIRNEGTESTAGTNSKLLSFDASRSSSIYGNSTTVEYSSTKLIPYMCVGNTESTSSEIDVIDITTSENDTIPLGYSTYSGEVLSPKLGWIKSEGQWNSGEVYATFYNEAVNGIGNDFGAGKIVENTDPYTDYDLVLNQTAQTFRLPLVTSERVLVSKKEPTNADPTWYNLYSDGWCEQGGEFTASYITISFSRQFIDTTYYIQASVSDESPTNYYLCTCSWNDKTSSSVTFYCGVDGTPSATSPCSWRAEGYCAIPTPSSYTESISLYYKVANAVQNLELLDVGEILNALTLKADKDFSNITNSAKSLSAGYAMPSNTYIDLTLGASDSTYIAPANGWFTMRKNAGAAGKFWYWENTTASELCYSIWSQNNGQVIECYLPVKKDDVIRVVYTLTGTTGMFRFIYAEGSESEAS